MSPLREISRYVSAFHHFQTNLKICDANKATQLSIHEGQLTCGLRGTQGQHPRDPLSLPIGPITRLRAKRFKEALNELIQEVWTQVNSWRPIEHGPRYHQRSITMIEVLEESDQNKLNFSK